MHVCALGFWDYREVVILEGVTLKRLECIQK